MTESPAKSSAPAPSAAARPAAEGLEIRTFQPQDDAARDAFLTRCEGATFFHRAGWRRAVERVFGHEGCDLLAWRGQEIVGVLPLMRTRGLLGSHNLLSSPYAVYGGPAAVNDAVAGELIEAAKRQADEERVGRLELRCWKAPPLELPGSNLYATFTQVLPDDPARVLAGMPKKARAEARKARERHRLELQSGVWYLDDLFRFFQRNKRSLGSPGLPMLWFRALVAEFGKDVVVHLVRTPEQALAAVLSFLWGDTLYAYYSGTALHADREFSASNFMYMSLREWAVGRGLRRFDFGRSRRDSGAFRFKEHQGFEASPLHYRYHLVRDRSLPSFTPSNPWTTLPRKLWSHLPAWLATRLSNRIAPYLP